MITMESSPACVSKAPSFSSSISPPGHGEPALIRANCRLSPRSSGSLRLKRPWLGKKSWKVVNCAKGGSVTELGNKLGDEIITEEDLMGFGRSREKCKETVSGGIAELLECLEREAIMGDDEGKEPTDYNRRALIFDKSSRVFQALRESTAAASATTAPTTTT